MRGLSAGSQPSQGSGSTGLWPNVAIYIDNQSGQLPNRNLDIYAADLNRIEVLEGPQGTLFGSGAEAGVIRYITNEPKLDVTEGSVKGGYGNVVILQHGPKYTTLYGHLSRFRPGLRVGQTVNQGQVIAYVGHSGLATSSHLHYEFRINGVHVNPVKATVARASGLTGAKLAQWRKDQATVGMLAQLDTLSKGQVAQAEPAAKATAAR